MNCKRCDRPIDQHEAGSETDACVAVVVMGSSKPVYPHSHPHINPIYTEDGYWICYPEYKDGDVCEWEAIPFSTKIFQAWKVIEKLNSEGYCIEIMHDCIAWSVVFMHINGEERLTSDWKCSLETQICRAALKCPPSNS